MSPVSSVIISIVIISKVVLSKVMISIVIAFVWRAGVEPGLLIEWSPVCGSTLVGSSIIRLGRVCMTVPNTLACNEMPTITFVESFGVQGPTL
jgi:hypothetical protein